TGGRRRPCPVPALGRSLSPIPLPTIHRYRSYQEEGRWASGMANPDMKGAARGIGQDLLALVQKIYNASQAQTGNISLANLRKVVAEEVKAAVNGTQEKRSWAAVASQGPTHSQAQPTTAIKIDILVRGKGMPTDLAKRTPQEIIQAVNQASTKKGAVAARKLPSGDTVITFQGMTTRDWYSTNSVWIKEAFGQQAEESKRTFAVLLKEVWKRETFRG
ncbi:hypothetical protein B0H66DRAFT_570101, partial [Apodospora peruviana]